MTEPGEHRGRREQPAARPPLLSRLPSKLGELPLILVTLGVMAGLTWVGLHHFKRGSVLIALALLFGAVLRLFLTDRQAGMLAVRNRTIDVLTLGGLGFTIAAAAVIVPPPS